MAIEERRWASGAGLLASSMALVVATGGAVEQRSDVEGTASAVRAALDQGEYAEADRLAALWLAATESRHGAESLEAARALDLDVEARLKNGRAGAVDTVALAERAVRVKERQLGPEHPDLAASLDNLGDVHTDRGEMRDAVPLHERALRIRRRAFAPEHPAVADGLDRLALPLILLQRFQEARRTLDESLRIRETGAERSPALARTLFLIGVLHRYDGRFADATPPLDRALEIRKQQLPPDHPDIRATIQMQGELSFLQGNIAGARSQWSTALDMAERTLRPDHPDIAYILRLLALAARAYGDLTTARQLLERALPIARRTLAPCHQGVPDLLSDLANISADEGDYRQAQNLTSAQLATYQRCLSPNDQRAATAIYNQALLAAEMGDLPQAERLHQRAIQMWSAGLGPAHPYVARGLDALASVVAAEGRQVRARGLYERALALRRRTLGPDHPDVAWTLTSIAQVTGDLGETTLALQRLGQAIDIFERVGGGDEPDHMARALELRGEFEARSGDYQAAHASFAEALAMREKIYGPAHPLVAATRAHVGAADFALGAPADALETALEAEHVGRSHLRFTIRYLPERQAMAYAAKRPRGLDLALSIIAANPATDSSAVLDSVIQSRGVILDELAVRAKSAVGSGPELAPLIAAVAAARAQFANLMLRSVGGQEAVPRELLDDTRRRKEEAERALAERSVAAQAESARSLIGLQGVQRSLPAGSAMISFVRYNRTTFTANRTGKTAREMASYVAFVAAPSATVAVVPLGSAASLETTIRAWRREIEGRSITAGLPEGEAERAYRAAGLKLRQRIWDPLFDHLRGASHVFIVPDGALNLVSFAALPSDGGRYLAESGPVLHFLSTERDLIPTEAVASDRGLLAVGGPAYDAEGSGPAPIATLRSNCGSPGSLRFEDLPGSRAEVRDISRIWSSAQVDGTANAASADEVTVLSGRSASKGAVIRASAGRRVVHLATHGFFLGSPCESVPGGTRSVGGLTAVSVRPSAVAANPLLFSGLAFAGANRQDGKGSRQSDGILTAEEVASLNLQAAEWVVLSACDTGLGDIRAGEGVFGLRRAFQIAGARTIIMSLWSVEDQSTREWMRALYEGRFRQHLSTPDAVQRANVLTLGRRRARGQSTHPFYWAGFVAAGDPK